MQNMTNKHQMQGARVRRECSNDLDAPTYFLRNDGANANEPCESP